jgi:hypothetical protein
VPSRVARFYRFLLIALFAIWWGGFTFYALCVVPIGHEILHSKFRQGLITQRVSQTLNLLGIITLCACVLEHFVCSRVRGAESRRNAGDLRTVEIACWAAMALSLTTLIYLHGHMDTLLATLAENSDERFYRLHRAYLLISSLQWLAGALYLFLRNEEFFVIGGPRTEKESLV